MKEAVQKAAVLIEALPYIQAFRQKTMVIKLGGSGMDDEKIITAVLRDLVFMRAVGMQPVIVPGGGRALVGHGHDHHAGSLGHGDRLVLRAVIDDDQLIVSARNALLAECLQSLGQDRGRIVGGDDD